MKKYLIVFFTLISGLVFSQNAAQLEGVWKNKDGEVLEMGWKIWTRKTPEGDITGTWEEVGPNTLHIRRVTGEEYDINFSVKGTTWAIEKPFSNQAWVWYRIQ